MNGTEPARNASKTALGVAALRAVHQSLDGEPKILHDPIAASLLSDDWRQRIMADPGYARTPPVMGLRAHVVLRSRYAEERLAAAVRRGVRQSVILGAGFDTFAYRQPEWAHALRIYEVDHGGTQAEKRLRLHRAGVAVPDNLEFVAIDFETTSLDAGLRKSSLDFSRPAFFSCLGVLVYLTAEAVEAVFRLVAGFPAGSEIAFTFSTEDRAHSAMADRVRALGEPWRTHFKPEALVENLLASGFSEVSVLQAEDAERLYFHGRSDGLRAPAQPSIAAAIVG